MDIYTINKLRKDLESTRKKLNVLESKIDKVYELILQGSNDNNEGTLKYCQGLIGPEGKVGPEGPESKVGPEGPEGKVGPESKVGPEGPKEINNKGSEWLKNTLY